MTVKHESNLLPMPIFIHFWLLLWQKEKCLPWCCPFLKCDRSYIQTNRHLTDGCIRLNQHQWFYQQMVCLASAPSHMLTWCNRQIGCTWNRFSSIARSWFHSSMSIKSRTLHLLVRCVYMDSFPTLVQYFHLVSETFSTHGEKKWGRPVGSVTS